MTLSLPSVTGCLYLSIFSIIILQFFRRRRGRSWALLGLSCPNTIYSSSPFLFHCFCFSRKEEKHVLLFFMVRRAWSGWRPGPGPGWTGLLVFSHCGICLKMASLLKPPPQTWVTDRQTELASPHSWPPPSHGGRNFGRQEEEAGALYCWKVEKGTHVSHTCVCAMPCPSALFFMCAVCGLHMCAGWQLLPHVHVYAMLSPNHSPCWLCVSCLCPMSSK